MVTQGVVLTFENKHWSMYRKSCTQWTFHKQYKGKLLRNGLLLKQNKYRSACCVCALHVVVHVAKSVGPSPRRRDLPTHEAHLDGWSSTATLGTHQLRFSPGEDASMDQCMMHQCANLNCWELVHLLGVLQPLLGLWTVLHFCLCFACSPVAPTCSMTFANLYAQKECVCWKKNPDNLCDVPYLSSIYVIYSRYKLIGSVFRRPCTRLHAFGQFIVITC